MITEKDLRIQYRAETGRDNILIDYVIDECDGSEDASCDAKIINTDSWGKDDEITTYSDDYVQFLIDKLLELLNNKTDHNQERIELWNEIDNLKYQISELESEALYLENKLNQKDYD